MWSLSSIPWQVYWNFTFHIPRIRIINSWAPRSNEGFHLSLQASAFRSELQWLEINAYYENSGNITERKSQVIYRTSPRGLQKLLILIWLGPVYRGILPKIPFLICVWLCEFRSVLKTQNILLLKILGGKILFATCNLFLVVKYYSKSNWEVTAWQNLFALDFLFLEIVMFASGPLFTALQIQILYFTVLWNQAFEY